MNQRFLHAFLMLSACWLLLMSCSGSDDPPEPVSNEYELDQAVFEIKTQMFRVTTSDQGAVEQLRLLEPLPDSNLFDLIIISPKSGSSSLEGVYVYSKTGDVGTYNLEFVHATDGQGELEWYTNGDEGDRLEIELMGKKDGEEVYRVMIPSFILNYGYWDYLASKWVSYGQKSFKFTYEGFISL